jgi:hypothetical protein
MSEQNKDLELIEWDTGIEGLRSVRLIPIKESGKAPDGYPIPVVVVRFAELQEEIQQQVIKIMSDAASAKEIAAAIWLEEQLDHSVNRSECISAVKKIRRVRSDGGGKTIAEKRIEVWLRKAFWTTTQDFELLKNVPGVYRLDEPGSSRSIESQIEWPKNVDKYDQDIDNWMRQKGQSGLDAEASLGRLISMGNRAINNVSGSMPSNQNARPKINRR